MGSPLLPSFALLLLAAGCASCPALAPFAPVRAVSAAASPVPSPPGQSATIRKVLTDAQRQTRVTHTYDPAYVSISYPNGDIPLERGVCADVIVRAYRAAGVDLQKAVHEDMRKNFAAYPKLWGLRRPDPNIDHRRVANLRTYFKRRGQSVPVTRKPADYRTGDVVAWELPGGRLHIGLVSDERVPGTDRPGVIHNIGAGARQEDVLLAWKILGHYRSFR
jgi:uncharacterized protein YijF (DUF1287 family)